jgi:hypothetical protein
MIQLVKIATARVNVERWTLAPKWFLRWIRKRLWPCSVSYSRRLDNLVSELEISKQQRGSPSKSLRIRRLYINKWLSRTRLTCLQLVLEELLMVVKPLTSTTCGTTSKLKSLLLGSLLRNLLRQQSSQATIPLLPTPVKLIPSTLTKASNYSPKWWTANNKWMTHLSITLKELKSLTITT